MAFYRIKEAAEKIGVVPHVLRFWESQFPTLKPNKTSRGQRLYSDEDVENFLKIKHLLYNEGYSIPGARKFLKESKSHNKSTENPASSAVEQSLREDFCKDLLEELKSLKEAIKEY
jgi:DNA-binding transcriptional MerR regulator